MENILKNTEVYDKKLNPVLEAATNEDLAPLVGYIKSKLSETLTVHSAYKVNPNNHVAYADLIADQIRDMGGNSISNMFRGYVGPAYYEIVCDVAKKCKATYPTFAAIEVIEKAILEKILKTALESMSIEEKKKMLEGLELGDIGVGGLTSSTLLTVFNAGGFYSYQLAVIIANQIAHLVLGHGLSFAANATLTKSLSIIAGPIGWAVCGIWTTIDIAGPAFKVTIPCVVHIAMLRMKMNAVRCVSCDKSIVKANQEKLCEACTKLQEVEKAESPVKKGNSNYFSEILYKYFERNNDLEGYEMFMKDWTERRERDLKEEQDKIERKKKKKEKKAKIAKTNQFINDNFKDRLKSIVKQVDENSV